MRHQTKACRGGHRSRRSLRRFLGAGLSPPPGSSGPSSEGCPPRMRCRRPRNSADVVRRPPMPSIRSRRRELSLRARSSKFSLWEPLLSFTGVPARVLRVVPFLSPHRSAPPIDGSIDGCCTWMLYLASNDVEPNQFRGTSILSLAAARAQWNWFVDAQRARRWAMSHPRPAGPRSRAWETPDP